MLRNHFAWRPFNFVDTFCPQIHESVPFSHKKRKFIYTHTHGYSQPAVCLQGQGNHRGRFNHKRSCAKWEKVPLALRHALPLLFTLLSDGTQGQRSVSKAQKKKYMHRDTKVSMSLPELAPLLWSSPCCFQTMLRLSESKGNSQRKKSARSSLTD